MGDEWASGPNSGIYWRMVQIPCKFPNGAELFLLFDQRLDIAITLICTRSINPEEDWIGAN